MFDRLKRLIALWNDRAQIMELTDRDLAELGVTRDQLLHVAQIPGSVADRMAAMAAIFGVSAEDLQFPRADYIQMLDTCQSCHSLKPCARVLADASATAQSCGFCPNAPAFAAA